MAVTSLDCLVVSSLGSVSDCRLAVENQKDPPVAGADLGFRALCAGYTVESHGLVVVVVVPVMQPVLM
jgi:hypothetical protein